MHPDPDVVDIIPPRNRKSPCASSLAGHGIGRQAPQLKPLRTDRVDQTANVIER